jgi:hypothetical protein
MKDQRAAVDEFIGLELGDARREARVRRIVQDLEVNPSASFPHAMKTVAGREAFYRLLNNEAVTLPALLEPHSAQTMGRLLGIDERPLIVIDRTKFVFEGEGDRDGLDRISNNKQSFAAFFALALSPNRRVHGVLGVELHPGTNGTSSAAAWNRFLNEAACDVEGAGVRPIFVMDREADTYELFCNLVDAGRDFVIRISFDRFIEEFEEAGRERVRDVAARAETLLTRTVRISRRKRGGRAGAVLKAFPPRPSREARLSIRACPISLPNPGYKKLENLTSALPLHLIQVVELKPPSKEEPIEWLLLTSLPIDDAASVASIVDAYRARWVIEEYFRALKTGCQYEARQLESLHALTNALGLLIPIAWKLLELRTIVEEEPDMSAAEVLDLDEIHVLRRLSKDIKLGSRPSVSEALLAVASLGGHIRQNGRPGWQVLFRGFNELLLRVDGYRLAKRKM